MQPPPSLLNAAGERGFLAWREIKKMLEMGAIETVDYTAKAAYAMLGDQWVSYGEAVIYLAI